MFVSSRLFKSFLFRFVIAAKVLELLRFGLWFNCFESRISLASLKFDLSSSFLSFLEFLFCLVSKFISFETLGKLILVSVTVDKSIFDSTSIISLKTELDSILAVLFSLKFIGKFAEASVIISFWATLIADDIPTKE